MLANPDTKRKKDHEGNTETFGKETTLKCSSVGGVGEARFDSCIPEDLFLCFALSSPGDDPRSPYGQREDFRDFTEEQPISSISDIFDSIQRNVAGVPCFCFLKEGSG